MAPPAQWTWVWASSRSWWWTGKPYMLQFMESRRVRHNWATELNWTELNNEWCWASFPVLTTYLYVFLGECLFRFFSHFLTGLFVFLVLSIFSKFWWHFHFSSLKDPSPPLLEVAQFYHLSQMDSLVFIQPDSVQNKALSFSFDLHWSFTSLSIRQIVSFCFLLSPNHNTLNLHPERYFGFVKDIRNLHY